MSEAVTIDTIKNILTKKNEFKIKILSNSALPVFQRGKLKQLPDVPRKLKVVGSTYFPTALQ